MVSGHFQINKNMSSRMAGACVPCSSHRWAGRSDIRTLCLRTQDTALPGPRRMCTPSPLKSHLPHTRTVSLPLMIISAVFFKELSIIKSEFKKIQIRVILFQQTGLFTFRLLMIFLQFIVVSSQPVCFHVNVIWNK